MPVFCGWFDGIKRPSFKSGKPQEYHCLGHSAILQYRYPFVRTFTANDTVDAILGDTPASQGLLFQASSMATPFWALVPYRGTSRHLSVDRADRHSLSSENPRAYASHSILGLLFLQRPALLPRWASISGSGEIICYVRTGVGAPEGSPEHYPCFIVGYKNCHVRAGSITDQNLSSPGMPANHERLMTTINRVVSHQGLEFNFVNRSDGDQDLDCDWAVYRGWYDDPQKSYVEADLIDFQPGTLDAYNYGFDAVIMKGRDTTWGYTFWSPMRWGREYSGIIYPQAASGRSM